MLKICFFARLREVLGTGNESLPMESISDVASLLTLLQSRGGVWADELRIEKSLQVAINHEIATLDSRLKEGDEVAFFPPVTGG
jgi:sulfur-carrier protein